jgi:hypothetical protein
LNLLNLTCIAATAATLGGCASMPAPEQSRPAWLTIVSQTQFDGRGDDLLTAGMGMDPPG